MAKRNNSHRWQKNECKCLVHVCPTFKGIGQSILKIFSYNNMKLHDVKHFHSAPSRYVYIYIIWNHQKRLMEPMMYKSHSNKGQQNHSATTLMPSCCDYELLMRLSSTLLYIEYVTISISVWTQVVVTFIRKCLVWSLLNIFCLRRVVWVNLEYSVNI